MIFGSTFQTTIFPSEVFMSLLANGSQHRYFYYDKTQFCYQPLLRSCL